MHLKISLIKMEKKENYSKQILGIFLLELAKAQPWRLRSFVPQQHEDFLAVLQRECSIPCLTKFIPWSVGFEKTCALHSKSSISYSYVKLKRQSLAELEGYRESVNQIVIQNEARERHVTVGLRETNSAMYKPFAAEYVKADSSKITTISILIILDSALTENVLK